MKKEDAPSPTTYLEIIMLTLVIEVKEDRDMATIDIPNFFIKTPIDRKPVEGKNHNEIKELLVCMDLEKYGPNVVL